MEKDYILISVESRKGGVGKTTAALNLAKRLKDKQYNVLFLDADITGTNTGEIKDNTFWKNSVVALELDGKPLNLLVEFKKKFMTNDFIPPFTTDKNDSKNIFIDVNKINILGSQLYSLDKRQDKFTCNPSVIFDELHAFWFIEYISLICRQFFNLSSGSIQSKEKENKERIKNEKYAVIIDNSPGYIGIAPILQEMLTDIGPVKGKFLFVTSLDRQDLISCKHAVKELYDNYKNKNNTAALFNGEIAFSWKDEYKKFFNKMVENVFPDINEGLSYYFKEEKYRNKYINNSEKFLAVLINKVPSLIKNGYFQYDYEKTLKTEKDISVFEKILCLNNNKIPDHFLISYNELIEYQFNQDSLFYSKLSKLDKNKIYKRFKDVFKDSHFDLSKPPYSDNSDRDTIISYFSHFNVFKRIPQNLKAFLINNQLNVLIPLLDDIVDFNDILVSFEHIFRDILERLGISSNFGFRTGSYNKITDFYLTIYIRAYNLLKQSRLFSPDETPMNLTIFSIYASFILFPYINKRYPTEEDTIYELFSFLVYFIYLKFKNEQYKSDEKISATIFLDRENSNPEDRYMEVNHQNVREFLRKYRIDNRSFYELYRKMISAMSYINFFHDNISLIENIIGQIINEGYYNLSYISMIRDILKKVFRERAISHTEGFSEFKNIQMETYKMDEFENAFTVILKNWEIE